MFNVNFYAHHSHHYHPDERRTSIVTTISASSSPPSTPTSTRPSSSISTESLGWYHASGLHSLDDLEERNYDLAEWTRSKPLSILQLDPADRAVLKIADERDEIQKKTFTKWVNKHLVKAGSRVADLYEDLRSGTNLLALIEVLSQELLPRERGRMRVHHLNNVQHALDYLKRKRIKLVNIRPDDIVDANQKLILGLIWTIILHYQISDIIQHDESITFKEVLLKWAQKTTEGYPGVKVTDFTNSWKDGLAFNAIIHRNRPDLLDYRDCRTKTNRENLETAFRVAERDLGVTRLLDPEDVDTKNVDEKSMITYISYLYELFPNPPDRNPLLDDEKLRRIEEYKDSSTRLLKWIKESTIRLNDRDFPNTIQEVKQLQYEQERFRTEEIPPKLHEKQRLAHSYREAVRLAQTLPNVYIDHELSSDNIEILWNRLITAHQERDNALSSEILRLEKMQRLAEKLLREIKNCDIRLDDIERQIVEEEKRVLKLHPLETKFNVEHIEREIKAEEDRIKIMFEDVQTLRDGRYYKANELHQRVQQLYQRWSDLRIDFQTRVLQPLAARREEALRRPLTEEELIASKNEFRFLSECIAWVQEKLKKLNEKDYGHDMNSVKRLLEEQRVEHRSINEFQVNVDKCTSRKDLFKGQEQEIYIRMLNRLCKGYSELLVLSNKRLGDLDSLLEFIQLSNGELKWLSEREEVEISRDWSDKNLNVAQVESHRQSLVNEMEKREIHFNSVVDRGESLIRQTHPATKLISEVMSSMQAQWSLLLQMVACLDIHLQNTTDYQAFYDDVNESTQWMTKVEDRLNDTYSRTNFTIEEGEKLLREMQELKDEISRYSPVINDIHARCKDIVPIKQRKAPLPRPIKVKSACMIKQKNVTIIKDETVTLHDNFSKAKWVVRTSAGTEVNAPGVCFVIPPPDDEAIATAEELKRRYEALIALWTKKQHKLRQNMIFATLKIVKGWDFPTYAGMDPTQRSSIIRALEDDIDKLVREGPPNDPDSRRLQDEMKALKDKFADFERRMKEDREFNLSADDIQKWMREMEKTLSKDLRISALRDVLARQVSAHEQVYREVLDKEHEVHILITRGNEMVNDTSRVSDVRGLRSKLDNIKRQWDNIKKSATDRHTRLQRCMDNCKKYHSSLEKFVPWLDLCEVKLSNLQEICCQRNMLEKQIKELQQIKNDISHHTSDFDNLRNNCDTFLSSVDIDKEDVREEFNKIKKRWDELNKFVSERSRALDALLQRLLDYQENARSLNSSLTRLEDRYASYDDRDSAKDPKHLDRIKALLAEVKGLDRMVDAVKSSADAVIAEADRNVDTKPIRDEVADLVNRHRALTQKLQDRCSDLDAASAIVAKFQSKLNNIHSDLNSLEEKFESFAPIGREITILNMQVREMTEFDTELAREKNNLDDASRTANEMISQGYTSDPKGVRVQIDQLIRQANKLQERSRKRSSDIQTMMEKVKSFYEDYNKVERDITATSKDEATFKPIAREVEDIREQQREFKSFIRTQVEPLGRRVEDTIRVGNGLIQSAASGVDTSKLEQDVDKLNERWNELKEKLHDRERRLDVALLQAGRFKEALDGVEKWLKDTEEMVANQKPPSADYKVVKAQLQEQRFLQKLIFDRQSSMNSLNNMGQELMKNLDAKERAQIERQLDNLMNRFEKLMRGAQERMDILEAILPVAKDFIDRVGPLSEWLDISERRLMSMMTVPTDESRIKQRIAEHRLLHQDILGHKRDFEDLTEIAQHLMSMVGDDEAQMVVDKLKELTERYTKLVEDSENLSHLLSDYNESLVSFVLNFEELRDWIEEMNSKLDRYRSLSVYPDKLREQLDELTEINEEIRDHQKQVSEIVASGQELMKHASGDDVMQVKDKLDALHARYNELVHRAADKLRQAQDAYPICDNFHSAHDRMNNWMDEAERALRSAESLSLNVQEATIQRLEGEIPKYRALLEQINHLGPQLGAISPGQGAATIDNMVTRTNRRFESICDQIQRKAERIELSKARNLEIINDIEELLDWFRDAEKQILEAEPIRPNPDFLAMILKEMKALNEDINSQKARVRDVLASAKKLMRDVPSEDAGMIRDKSEELKELSAHVSQLAMDRLNALEQALPLAEHFFDSHGELIQWLDEAEGEADMLGTPAVHEAQIRRQQERCKALLQAINEHKPLVDRINKSGISLCKLCSEVEAVKIRQIMDSDNNRYNALKNKIREHQNTLEEALHATSQFVDKLDSMLAALKATADQLKNAEPIAAHPERIREQIHDNNAILADLEKRSTALEAIRAAAKDVISKAGKSDEPAIKDIKKKLAKLNDLWDDTQKSAKKRGRSLDDALRVAQRFWDQLASVMKTLRELQDTLNAQEPPAVEPKAITQQKDALREIHQDMKQAEPQVEQCRQTGKELMTLCGEPDKPEVKKNIEDLDQAWETVTGLYFKREKNLAEAMEKAMNFHDLLRNILAFLDSAEERFARLGPIASDIDAVRKQIDQLQKFKSDVDSHMVEVEALNRHAQELMERTTPNQARAIREPLNGINKRWDHLLKGIVDRQNELENALLRLGQFFHSLDEFMAWINKTERTLDDMRPTFADAQILEVELAKHKVLMNDIRTHQTTVDTLNKAGRMLIESDREDAKSTTSKLNTLNSRWQQLQNKAAQRQRELEDLLKEALAFNQEIKDILNWLADLDGQFSASKPVGGLPETAKEQLARFMELYNELDANRHKVENILHQGHEYVRKAPEGMTPNLQTNLKTLKSRWEAILNRANDRKIKLEIALREATEFHDALQEFTDWLSSAEKYLANLQPISLVMDHILPQIEEHKNFQRDVSNHRETMLNLDKKGTHLKYFSQKQDVILIKNLLVSVQHRWERVVAKAAERTRGLDKGYKEAKEFHDAWTSLIKWLTEAEEQLDRSQPAGNNPETIRQFLNKHKEFQRALGAKQATYDATIRLGKSLRDKCPKTDVPILTDMIDELKRRWNAACAKSVDRQRKLEEALLFSGQFKDAVQALIDWLDKAKSRLGLENLFGDLDTVTALVEQHKAFQEDLKGRSRNLATVKKTANDLLETATASDAALIREQLNTLESRWEEVVRMSDAKQRRLDEALRSAEELHKSVHSLLEWLSDAEMKLRFAGPLPDDEDATRQQITELETFMREMSRQEVNKDSTIKLANEILGKCHPDAVPVIRHWVNIITSRWDEVANWAKQRENRLQEHLRSLRNIMDILEELLAWLRKAEADLLAKESEPLPDDISQLEMLIEEHQLFIDDMSSKQDDVEKVAKAFSTTTKRAASRQSSNLVKGRRSNVSTPVNGHGKGLDAEIKNPKARELVEKWRSVWLLAMERMRRLQDKLDYLREVERVKNFDFDEWRRRFLGWMNNKKARVMDFFRKIDKDNDGKVTQAEFIDGFLKSKFPTSRLEMERVAPIFDRNSDGFIDHKEYIETLRPDRDLKTEAEIIQDEVQRLVAKCTCVHRYKVFQVGEGRYRFGDSQKLRLVRILRSTVMVRVGGGWVSLDEFLIKNDPCRAKGRTNIELREKFILADGVSQGMAAFKSKKPIVDPETGAIPTVGPIMKIREKTERSIPMHHRHRTGDLATSDYSYIETESGTKSRPRSRMTPGSIGGSRPSSRHSSRGPSRASSDMSSESLEGFKQRQDRSTSRTRQTVTTTSSSVSQMRRTPSFGPNNGSSWQ